MISASSFSPPSAYGHYQAGGFVDRHQRRLERETRVHAEGDRRGKRLQRLFAAIGIAGKVGLAHAADQPVEATAIPDRGREGEEQQVAARYEVLGRPAAAWRIARPG